MDRWGWWAAVHGVAKSRTWLSDFTLTFHFHALEKEMATHSSGLAWRIPGTGEPGGLLSMGSRRVGHDWSNLAAAACVSKSLSLVRLSDKTKSVCRTRLTDEKSFVLFASKAPYSTTGCSESWRGHYSIHSEWLLVRRQQITSIDENVHKRESLCTVGRNANWCSQHGKWYGDCSEIKTWNHNMIQKFHF